MKNKTAQVFRGEPNLHLVPDSRQKIMAELKFLTLVAAPQVDYEPVYDAYNWRFCPAFNTQKIRNFETA